MLPKEDDSIKTKSGSDAIGDRAASGDDVREPGQIVAKSEKLNEPKPEPAETDEFGLPSRPRRRREYSVSLGDLETPDEIAKKVIEETGGSNLASVQIKEEDESQGKEGVKPTQDENASEEDFATPRTSLDKPEQETTIADILKTPQSISSSANSNRNTLSEYSHQQISTQPDIVEEKEDEGEWQEMPALATHRIYDDWGKVLAKEYGEADDQKVAYGTLGGAGKGYTRVQVDEDAQSATSLDENTAYLFKEPVSNALGEEEEEESRDLMSQMQATKELLTEGQRIAYVGIVRLSMVQMTQDVDKLEKTKSAKKAVEFAFEAIKMWSQKIMVKLYAHMEIDAREQIMVEQLAEHGVLPSDLTPTLMANARVKNPNAAGDPSSDKTAESSKPSSPTTNDGSAKGQDLNQSSTPATPATESPPPAYQEHTADQLTVQDPHELDTSKNIDIDLRWTVLCDLFLLLISESTYDARSRTLLEKVGESLSVDWQEICRFEKRITDALEVQEQAEKENWNEDDHLEARRKAALRKRYVVMGLCTVGGGIIIGLSSGLLAPVIGAGLAAGFTGIGVAGTGTFLGGAGAAALIGTTGTLIGGGVGLKTSNRRTGAVKTFEYKPLYNNKRVNLIVTVAGWMTGKVDDVRLPFSTVDPVMGDIYSVNWEPDMLQSTGATIQILATEALTSTIQQILGATMLATLMAGISPPIILLKISYLIDNPWTVSLARADATGLILADSLIDRNLGVRPVTLVGFSLGSRVIFSCLKELAKRGAIGLVQNVYMFGSPVVAQKDEYIRARSIVSGRFVNGYATNDWILGYLFRATSGGIRRVAGLSKVEVAGIENRDITEWVPGHMAYRGMMPVLLDQVGWTVESLEFTEIEDPDPENHEKQQRELMNEIEEARRKLDEQPEKKGFKAFFSRKKASQKKAWETYDERSARVLEGDEKESERMAEENQNVLFDVDAIRKEALALALQNPAEIDNIKQHLNVREIQSTLPALKVSTTNDTVATAASRPDTSPASATSAGQNRPDIVRQAHSYDANTPLSATASSAATGAGLTALHIPKHRAGRSSQDLPPHVDSPASSSDHATPTLTAPAPSLETFAHRSTSYHLSPASPAISSSREPDVFGLAKPPPSREVSRSPADERSGESVWRRQPSPAGGASATVRSASSPMPQGLASSSFNAPTSTAASAQAETRGRSGGSGRGYNDHDYDDDEFGHGEQEVEMSFE
ncbi:DUF726-domain-containing protein [Dissoconium aciculare CBS 342.82]|uniref:DUF726-domain-containing protein n=1 Tax=Dissoconium aciculare CBS 342.82 TaxID=1314786 RepID=A0A6J3LQD9_9PEZI|nr:DUF726-domain-containing protein [Dissoconium aciculare CBS 342.82]KAF1818111.1 DUF726-domain-containing protein [Dissoconium aciculare CBS 342.82]